MRSKPVLFPHAYIPEPALKKINFFLGPVRIYQPWFLISPPYFKNFDMEAVYPPEYMKPSLDFRAVLADYHFWAEQTLDRNIKEIAKFGARTFQEDNATWEIRQLLKGSSTGQDIKQEDLTVKQNLLLHLYSDMERQQFELTDMVEKLKGKSPILSSSLHEPGEAMGIFDDADDLVAPLLPDNQNMRSLLDAWFSLFSGYLKDNDLLITCSRSVMDYIISRWDEASCKGKTGDIRQISFDLPDQSSDGDISNIRKIILSFGEDPEHSLDPLDKLTRESRECSPYTLSKGHPMMILKHFPSISFPEGNTCDKIITNIAGKTLALME
jgi:hypothetical protein